MVFGVVDGLQPLELIRRYAFAFQHHRNVVINPVDSLAVLCDQSFGECNGYFIVACIIDGARRNLMVNLLKLVCIKCSETLFAYWATQNFEQLSVDGHRVYLPEVSAVLTMG